MFDFAWSEIALIGVVALVLIGPKDLPIAIKAVTGMVKKARRMAAEFQTHVDEMVKDADLHEVRDQIREIRSLDIRGTIARAVDKDGTIRAALQDPIRTPPPPAVPVTDTPDLAPLPEVAVEAHPEHSIAAPVVADAPAFIPPTAVSPAVRPDPVPVRTMPAFVPPEAGPSPLL
jgi:sec-independent protein translocase protein TatB